MLIPVPRVQVLVPLLTLPCFRKGEFMHGVALDDEVRGARQHVTAVASGGRGCSFTSGGPVLLVVFVPVEWADVPDEWRGAGAAAAVAVVLRDCCASRSYARWYWQANSDVCIYLQHRWRLCARLRRRGYTRVPAMPRHRRLTDSSIRAVLVLSSPFTRPPSVFVVQHSSTRLLG